MEGSFGLVFFNLKANLNLNVETQTYGHLKF